MPWLSGYAVKGQPLSLEIGTYSSVLSIINDDWELLLL